MKKILMVILLIMAGITAAYFAGVRIHPEVFFAKKEVPSAGLYKISFRSGQVMFAELIEERAQDLTVRAGGSTFDLAKSDLMEFRPVNAADSEDPAFAEWHFFSSPKTWISYSKEKNQWLKMLKQANVLKDEPGKLISSAIDRAGEMASSQGKANPGKMAMYESIVRKNVGKKTEY